MPYQVVTTATLQCTFGAAPSVFQATPKMVQSSFQDAGNIMDHVPMTNIKPFGVCSSPANPAVAAATAAAMGVLTPQPCVPNTPAPWVPGSPTVLINFMPALNNTSKLMCIWGGVISVTYQGQATHQIP
ncbi:DUF4280 domain-containing protein [Rhodovulum sp. DZ06]|uniref:DUF4280 domain-containing protein n=1 Tax=Rhodovulum sp. DZ06 TaxID=3425126 RepID=UPI003D32763A